jgi:endonuclease YncB( thermonuclease family)
MPRRSLVVAAAVAAFLFAASFVCQSLIAEPAAPMAPKVAPKTITVFKAPTGKKYHCEDCRFVWERIGDDPDDWIFKGDAIELEAARTFLDPCKVCSSPASTTKAEWKKIVGKVERLKDADTIIVLDAKSVRHEIRLEGIDAPESDQASGDRAKARLSEKILDKEVRIEWMTKDKYERKLGHIYLGERWINLEMVQKGFAWHYKKYSTDKRLADAEIAARAAKDGLWAEKSPQAPWDFRAYEKANAKAKKLTPLESVHSAVVKLAMPGAATTVIHVCDWHMLGAKEFMAYEKSGRSKPFEEGEAVKLYEKHLADVEAVQKDQVVVLRTMIQITFEKSPRVVFQEGLTPGDMKVYKALAEVLASSEKAGDAAKFRESILRHGATGRLYREGALKDVLPLEDAAAWKAAYPVRDDGTVVMNDKAMEKREDAQVAAMLKHKGIVIVVLGGAHDLTDNLQRAETPVEYVRVQPRAYRRLAVASETSR